MATYHVPLTTWANISVTVETDETDPEAIAELAVERAHASLCHQCAGSRNNGLEVGDEWETVQGEDGAPEVNKAKP